MDALSNSTTVPALEVKSADGNSVFKLMQDGRLFWNESEIKGDCEFKAAMIQMSSAIVHWFSQSPNDRECAFLKIVLQMLEEGRSNAATLVVRTRIRELSADASPAQHTS